MTLQDLNNPKNIQGILVWRNGKCYEIGTDEKTAFQETNGCIELWEQWSGERIVRVERWFKKKTVTHYLINNEFVLTY